MNDNFDDMKNTDYDDTPPLFSLLEVFGLFALFVFLVFSIIFVILLILKGFNFDFLQDLTKNWKKLIKLCSHIAFCVATVCMVWLVNRRLETTDSWESLSSYLGFFEPNWRFLVKWTLIFAVFSSLLWGSKLSSDQLKIQENLLAYGIWLSLFGSVIVAPICEEIFFRGILWRAAYDKSQNFTFAFWVSSIFFALAHLKFSPSALIHYLIFSYIAVSARLNGGTLLFAIFLHFLSNFLLFLETLIIMSKS